MKQLEKENNNIKMTNLFRSHKDMVFASLSLILLLMSACAQSSTSPGVTATGTVSSASTPTPIPTIAAATVTAQPATPSPTSPPKPAPAHYISQLVLRGVDRPDDLAFDPQGRLLFSDPHNNVVGRVNTDGSVSVLHRGIAGPEGLVVLPDGTLIVAEQNTNRILSFAPGAQTPMVLRTLPGAPSAATCKNGVDGIALDPTTNTLILPDSPTGAVYRMSLDGKTFTRLSSGIVRPVGAGVDKQGTIYIADECGNAVWRITPAGQTTRIGGFGMPDDVIPDGYGNLLVIDLEPSIHALIRMNLANTSQREILASQGFIEPQGLVVDAHGNIFVADDYANIIMEFKPA